MATTSGQENRPARPSDLGIGVVVTPRTGSYEPDNVPNSIKNWRALGEQIVYLGTRDDCTYWLSLYDPTQNASVDLSQRDAFGFVYSFSKDNHHELRLCSPFDLTVEFYSDN